jgi:secreted PhoX family phosphatase
MAVSPWGDLFVAQDEPGSGRDFVTIVSASGVVSRFARNALDTTEIAGVCFRPGGRTLFLNLYGTDTSGGLTLAVWGPW